MENILVNILLICFTIIFMAITAGVVGLTILAIITFWRE